MWLSGVDGGSSGDFTEGSFGFGSGDFAEASFGLGSLMTSGLIGEGLSKPLDPVLDSTGILMTLVTVRASMQIC